jgi:hypothetical protein
MESRLNRGKHTPVKRLLRRRGSKHYFNGDGWTANVDEAKNFSDVIEAAETCARHGLIDVEVTLHLERCEVFCTPLR